MPILTLISLFSSLAKMKFHHSPKGSGSQYGRTTREYIGSARSGREPLVESFNELAKQYEPMIHNIINTLHIYKDREEYYQIGLIGLWDAMKNFDREKGHFSSFAYIYIKGRMLSELGKNHKQEKRMVCPKEEYWDTVEEVYSQQPLEYDLLLAYCNQLTEKEKKWVIASCLYGYSVKEIAERENVSVSAVKQWRSNAKRKLRMQLERMEP